jgi:hypothetical protein
VKINIGINTIGLISAIRRMYTSRIALERETPLAYA